MHKSTYLESTTLVNLPNREQPEPRTGLTKEINAEIGKSATKQTGKARGQIIQKTKEVNKINTHHKGFFSG
jgi:hypothetical protein